MTQAEQLIRALRRRWMTWGDMEQLRVSTSPWKRISETGHRYLKEGEKLDRRIRNGLVELKVVRG